MLDGDKLVEFIGHATVNSPLDDFLKENGIKSRPKGKFFIVFTLIHAFNIDFINFTDVSFLIQCDRCQCR